MNKSFVAALFLSLGFLGGCAMPAAQSGGTTSAAGSTANAKASSSEPAGTYRTVWVAPQTGSLLGGGAVRVPTEVQGNDERALLGTIDQLNAAAGTKTERPFVIAAVSRSTGVSEKELQAQQDLLRLQFGQLCAINAIARSDSNKVKEIATLKSQGRTWTQLAAANGMGIATVVQTARNANEMTVNSFSNTMERAKGGQQKLKELGVKIQRNPNS